jgi:eukaryotic-like serine/threonine-protein kinase
MAPEQVQGCAPSSLTDLFALGLVLHEMALGKLPFPGALFGQMLSSSAQAVVPALSKQRPEVPATLNDLIVKLLEKDPSRRPQSATEWLTHYPRSRIGWLLQPRLVCVACGPFT